MAEGAWPLVSVIIPICNEAGAIETCLSALLEQDYPAERLEILVVDGRSTDGSGALVQQWARGDGRIRLLDNPGRIVPTGMNVGIRAARGDIIARVDGHTRIAPDYLRKGVEALRRTRAANVGGPMHAVGGGAFGDGVAAAMSSRFGIGAYFHFGTEEREVDTVYLGMWPRGVFAEVGLFDEEFVRNQDDELNYRIRKAGGRIVLDPTMRSKYQNRVRPGALMRQFYQYGLWKVRVLQKHPGQMSWRHFVPPSFVALVGVGVAAAPAVQWARFGLGLLLGAYAVGLIAATVMASRARVWRVSLAAAAAFVIIHVAWGSGFLAGLVRFANRWGRTTRVPRLSSSGEAREARSPKELETGL